MSTDVPVHKYTCSVCFFFFAWTAQWPFNSSTGVPTHRSTRKYIYLFTFMLLFRLTTKTYLSPQLLVDMHIAVPVHDPTCHLHTVIPINRLDLPVNVSTALHIHRYTCSSVYLFSLFLHFRHKMYSYLSTHLLGYVHTDPHASPLPRNKDLPVTTPTCVPALKCTRSWPCLFIFIL